jgi:hypothetical protein
MSDLVQDPEWEVSMAMKWEWTEEERELARLTLAGEMRTLDRERERLGARLARTITARYRLLFALSLIGLVLFRVQNGYEGEPLVLWALIWILLVIVLVSIPVGFLLWECYLRRQVKMVDKELSNRESRMWNVPHARGPFG